MTADIAGDGWAVARAREIVSDWQMGRVMVYHEPLIAAIAAALAERPGAGAPKASDE